MAKNVMDGVAATLGKGSKCIMLFNESMVVVLPSGVKAINVANHGTDMLTPEEEYFFLKGSGFILNAEFKVSEPDTKMFPGVNINSSKTVPTEEGLEFLDSVPSDVLVIGSKIAAETYKGRVVMMNSAPGYERAPFGEKRMSTENFTMFK